MSTLSDYVMRRLEAGRSGTEICAELMAVGWSREAADAAYRDGLVALGIPLPPSASAPSVSPTDAPRAPEPQKAATMDIAVNVFSLILLAIVVGAFITLSFHLINRLFPEPQELAGSYQQLAMASLMHRSIASMAIAFPLYVFALSWWLRRFGGNSGGESGGNSGSNGDRIESPLTKRLTYAVLLIAAIVIVCDLIALVYSLLQGEVTPRFLLKVCVVLGTALLTFGFYWFERRSVQFGTPVPASVFKRFGWGAALLALAAVAAGYLSAGSPQVARSLAADARRSQHLLDLSRCIERYAGAMGQLPESLEQLERTSQYMGCPTYDPETRQRFDYRIITASRVQGAARVGEVELCANFSLASVSNGAPLPQGAQSWTDHPAGRHCRVSAVPLGGAAAK